MSQAPGTFFFFLSILFFIYVYTYDYNLKATTTLSGPNDAIHVFWALGEFFLIFYSLFSLILIKLFLGFRMYPVVWAPVSPLHHYTTTPLHGHVTTPSYHHQAAAGDEGSRPACLEPLEVCFFFLLSLTILIYLHLQL